MKKDKKGRKQENNQLEQLPRTKSNERSKRKDKTTRTLPNIVNNISRRKIFTCGKVKANIAADRLQSICCSKVVESIANETNNNSEFR